MCSLGTLVRIPILACPIVQFEWYMNRWNTKILCNTKQSWKNFNSRIRAFLYDSFKTIPCKCRMARTTMLVRNIVPAEAVSISWNIVMGKHPCFSYVSSQYQMFALHVKTLSSWMTYDTSQETSEISIFISLPKRGALQAVRGQIVKLNSPLFSKESYYSVAISSWTLIYIPDKIMVPSRMKEEQ